MKIHALRTGSVTIRRGQVRGSGPGPVRQLRTMAGEWTDPLPILAWAIEHPDGVIVVDTGDRAEASEPGWFPRWHPYFRRAVRIAVRPEEEIGPLLVGLGIEPDDVRRVVLTHLHTDHVGGVHHFPRSEILATRGDVELASGFAGQLRGYLPQHWPDWFAPQPIELRPEPFGPFPESLAVTDAGDVRVVPTPGHTPGHVSVVVDEGDQVVFLAGDTSYTEALMEAGAIDGVSPDAGAARASLERIRALTRERPTVYLPTHDPGSPARLRDRRTVAT